jgi:hypothetical protein
MKHFKLSLYQAVETYTVVRCRGSTFSRQSTYSGDVSLTRRPRLPPGGFLVLISVRN